LGITLSGFKAMFGKMGCKLGSNPCMTKSQADGIKLAKDFSGT